MKGAPHILDLEDYATTDDAHWLVMLNLGITLADYIRQDEWACDIQKIGVMVKALLEAVRSCHDNKIIHRDIKPENILVKSESNSELSVTLIDFGLAIMGKKGMFWVGTVGYTAPEMFVTKDDPPYGCEVYVGPLVFP